MAGLKTVIVIVAYNAEKTLEKTYRDIPAGIGDLVCVDDASKDGTVRIARELNLALLVRPKNQGYGASQKTGYREALKRGAEIVVLLHADYQYDPRKIPELIDPILRERAEVVLGSRIMGRGALRGGMPFWKYCANRLSTALANAVFGMRLTDYHSGFRAYHGRALRALGFEGYSDNYIFDAQMIAGAVSKKMRIAEIPIATRYFKEASSITFWPCVRYGLGMLGILFRYLCVKE
ncbi:MAG TPA: glycosyltransferase family 2 protein [Patescibacteria group bacterium]|nr:glycosyltransferase family 2 protein [Patescibacteria group bacterium]